MKQGHKDVCSFGNKGKSIWNNYVKYGFSFIESGDQFEVKNVMLKESKWIGIKLQYMKEDKTSNKYFIYRPNIGAKYQATNVLYSLTETHVAFAKKYLCMLGL